ncbi:MAG: Bax inhibitor-1 family protein [Planctomycetes bacterium]|nr:Bax inhibitor-1 family protein [Planctomycetota bacterium]
MTAINPYSTFDDNQVAAHAPATERAIFLRKTYSLVFLGVLAFAAALYLSAPDRLLHGAAMALRFSPIVSALVFLGSFYLVRWVATTPVGLPLFFAFAVFWGLLAAPMILAVAGLSNGAALIGQASLLTAIIFFGLTAYVWKSGKDFSFLGGALTIGFFAMLGIALCGWLFGFSIGIWFSVLGVVVMSGYILYDTSAVMLRYPTNMYVAAALELFTDIVMLFRYLLDIVLSFSGND